MKKHDLRAFLKLLKKEDEIQVIDHKVDTTLELANIHREEKTKNNKALLFSNVGHSPYTIATNLFGSKKRIELALPTHPEKRLQDLLELTPQLQLLHLGKRKRFFNSFKKIENPNLNDLPFIKCAPKDGGFFMTLGATYTQHPHSGKENLGLYRLQRHSAKEVGVHMQIEKGGGFHYHEAEKRNEPLETSIFLGLSPALLLSSIAPLPENISELLFASFLQNKKIDFSKNGPHPLLNDAECVLKGKMHPFQRKNEGPFFDHYGCYDNETPFPYMQLETIYQKKNPIIPHTIVGQYDDEDATIGIFLQELFAPLIKFVMPTIRELWSYPEAGFHTLTGAIIDERYEKEALKTAFKILSEGQLSLTKFLILTDTSCAIRKPKELLEAALARFDPQKGFLILSHTAQDSLDDTGPKKNHGSKAILIGTGKEKRKLPDTFEGPLPFLLTKASLLCKGALLIEGPEYTEMPDPSPLFQYQQFVSFPLLILVDEGISSLSEKELFFELFKRFEPGSDIFSKEKTIVRNGVSFSLPLLIDARRKPQHGASL